MIILTYYNIFKIKNHLFDEMMHIAILENKTDFVKLFVENDFSLKQFLTYERLLQLYNEVNKLILFELKSIYNWYFYFFFEIIPKSTHLLNLFQKDKKFSNQLNKRVSYKQIGRVIEYALNDFVESKFTSKEYEKYEYVETAIARSSFRTNDTTNTTKSNS